MPVEKLLTAILLRTKFRELNSYEKTHYIIDRSSIINQQWIIGKVSSIAPILTCSKNTNCYAFQTDYYDSKRRKLMNAEIVEYLQRAEGRPEAVPRSRRAAASR